MTRSNTKSSLGFLKSIKNVKSFLTRAESRKKKKRQQQSSQPLQQEQQQPNQQQQHETFTRQGIALTFSTEFVNTGQDPITLLHPNLSFMPNQSASSSSFDNKAYVHYEPKKAQVALGTNPDAKHTKSLRLSVEQYAWLIQQLMEEQGVHDSIHTFLGGGSNSIQLVNTIRLFSNSPMLGVLSVQNYTRSLGQRLIRLVQRRRVTDLYRQCIFMLPKALLLQAAAYIPMTKPLPAPLASINTHLLYNTPFEVIQGVYHQRLLRYCRYIPLCTHELVLGAKTDSQFYNVKCTSCHYATTIQQQQQQPQQITPTILSSVIEQTFMFPISFIHYPFLNNAFATNNHDGSPHDHSPPICTASAIPPQRNNNDDTIDNFVNSKPHAYSAFQYIPPDRTLSNNASSISAFSGIQEEIEEDGVNEKKTSSRDSMDSDDDDGDGGQYYRNDNDNDSDEEEEVEDDDDEEDEQANSTVQKYGYVAVDRKHEEILVVFPGMSMSHSMFENASFVPVPWHEVAESQKLKQTQNEQHMSLKNPNNNNNNGSSKASKRTKNSNIDTGVTAEEDTAPWVLECALTAWHRCEMKVVTLLMRLCSTMPSHYKVTIVGHSLGGAVASLCAFSLRSTKLLTDRLITVVAVHPPRVGNKAFVESLQEEVDTIRITDFRDIMAHLPPRTSGLLHSGNSTVILPVDDNNGGYVLDHLSPCETEDILNRTFTLQKYESDHDRHAWGILLDDEEETCIIQE